jgi:tRNA-Thr(GGU) m(6)t(6)A37 methyltransferase TsaA
MRDVTMRPIGVVHSERKVVEDDAWDSVRSFLEIDGAEFTPDALAALDDFSHVEVVFYMDRVDARKIEKGARHPRNNRDWPSVGILAQRGKNRSNQIGTTVCRIDRIDGLRIHVTGLDAIDGTPVLDVKPWVRQFGPRGEVRQPPWMDELMERYW